MESIPDPRRFWEKVQKGGPDECWLWRGYREQDGYGRVVKQPLRRRTYYRAHRLAWWFVNGPIPESQCVCHQCDTPPCCNPNHLFLGTQAENQHDRARKGRGPQGERNGRARLSEAQARFAIACLHSGMMPAAIARELVVSYQSVWKIKRGKAWRHLCEQSQPAAIREERQRTLTLAGKGQ